MTNNQFRNHIIVLIFVKVMHTIMYLIEYLFYQILIILKIQNQLFLYAQFYQ